MTASSFLKSTFKNGISKSNTLNYAEISSSVSSGLVLELDAANPNSYSGTGTTWTDLSGQGNNATLVNSPSFGKDPYGYIEFNGPNAPAINQYAKINPNSALRVSNTWTVNVWLKWIGGSNIKTWGTSRQVLFGNRNVNTPGCFQCEIGLGNDQGRSANATYPGTWIVSTQQNTIPLDKWINICWVQNSNNTGGGIDVYLNGMLLPKRYLAIAPLPQQAIADVITIGSNVDSNAESNQWFSGRISYLSAYNTNLSRSQILQNYNSIKNRFIDESNSNTISSEYLVVGGGGGGGYAGPGGGGAGGFVTGNKNIQIGSSYTITVGSGGQNSGASNQSGATGGDSVFDDITAYGGGGGASGDAATLPTSGGSGGGGSYNQSGASGKNGQGHAGGSSSSTQMSGGGGGAGSPGNTNGDGGFGVENSITGVSVVYASGGGGYVSGGSYPGGGAPYAGANATDGLGGGGGGNASAFRGGHGVVILAYPSYYPNITTIPGALTFTLDTTTRPGYKVYKFTAGTGSVTI